MSERHRRRSTALLRAYVGDEEESVNRLPASRTERPKQREVKKTWGHELIVVTKTRVLEAGYTLKILTCEPKGEASSIHYHMKKTETFFVLDGDLKLEIWLPRMGCKDKLAAGTIDNNDIKLGRTMRLRPGEAVTLEPLVPHRFWANGVRTRFVETSTPDSPDDSYRIVVAGPAPAPGG
jgi:mannose-6-phosphate isomerase-like protein (cupin superfamily)